MYAPNARTIILLALVCFLPAFAGCKVKSNTRSTVEMSTPFRHVKATLDKLAMIRNEGNNFIVTFGNRKLVVETDRVLLDDKEQTKIPATAASVTMEFIDGKLSVIADGKTLRESSPPN